MVGKTPRVTEGSCWSCRRRRVKCDIQKPTCSRCVAYNQECIYGKAPLKWLDGTSRRVLPSSRVALSSSLSVSSTELSMSADRLLPYFAHVVIPRLKTSDEPVDINLSFIARDMPFQKAVLAVAAAHYSQYTKDISKEASRMRQSYRHSAISSFRKSLMVDIRHEEEIQSVFMVNVLLCLLDGVMEPLNESCASDLHLCGGKAIIQQWPQLPDTLISKRGLSAHLLSVFSTIDLFQSLLGGGKPVFAPSIWPKFGNVNCWWGKILPGDTFLKTMQIFAIMAVHGHQMKECFKFMPQRSVTDIEDLGITIKMLPGSIELQQLEAETASLTPLRDPAWQKFCALYLVSARIYQYRVLANLSSDHSLVQQQVYAGVELLREASWSGMLAHCVIFPLLLIGSHCLMKEQRAIILRSLTPSAEYLSFGNLQVMAEFFYSTWQQDGHTYWWNMFEKLSTCAFLF